MINLFLSLLWRPSEMKAQWVPRVLRTLTNCCVQLSETPGWGSDQKTHCQLFLNFIFSYYFFKWPRKWQTTHHQLLICSSSSIPSNLFFICLYEGIVGEKKASFVDSYLLACTIISLSLLMRKSEKKVRRKNRAKEQKKMPIKIFKLHTLNK